MPAPHFTGIVNALRRISEAVAEMVARNLDTFQSSNHEIMADPGLL